jgi:hypothetical protein
VISAGLHTLNHIKILYILTKVENSCPISKERIMRSTICISHPISLQEGRVSFWHGVFDRQIQRLASYHTAIDLVTDSISVLLWNLDRKYTTILSKIILSSYICILYNITLSTFTRSWTLQYDNRIKQSH